MNFVDYYFNVIQICPSAFVRGTPLQGSECDFKVRLGGSFLLVICLIFFFLKLTSMMKTVNSLLFLCLLARVNVQQHAKGGCLLHA